VDADDGLVVRVEFTFQFVEFLGEAFVGSRMPRNRTKARMISMLTAMACGLLSTEESIATFAGRVWWSRPNDSNNLIVFNVKSAPYFPQWSRLLIQRTLSANAIAWT